MNAIFFRVEGRSAAKVRHRISAEGVVLRRLVAAEQPTVKLKLPRDVEKRRQVFWNGSAGRSAQFSRRKGCGP